MQSAILHGGFVALIWILSFSWMLRHPLTAQPRFDPSQVTYYSQTEYLQPLDTGTGTPATQKGDPVYSRQEIISVPPESDNQRQTIVVPPDLRLAQEQPLPNIVAWSPASLIVPLSATTPSQKLPSLAVPVVAPPPELNPALERHAIQGLGQSVVAPAPDAAGISPSTRNVGIPQVAVVEPPPNIGPATTRRYGDLKIGHASVVAPAPQLPMQEERAFSGRLGGSLRGAEPAAVPPPPSVSSGGGSGRGSQLIALGVQPVAPSGPIDPPAGNRRGTFAAGPSGHAGASGIPGHGGAADGNSASTGAGDARGGGSNGSNKAITGVPPGLHVGPAPGEVSPSDVGGEGNGTDPHPAEIASTIPPKVTGNVAEKVATPLPDDRVTDLDRQVFGVRRVYSMTLNMPNLNSAGGSWIIRFSELKQGSQKGELIAPEATHKVDPGYPLELIRQNVQGTVVLRAVIHSDGRVSDVEVLSSPDSRLDRFAQNAFERWQFRPGMKNGSAVALEAVVSIPFRHSSF